MALSPLLIFTDTIDGLSLVIALKFIAGFICAFPALIFALARRSR
jgi:hypothetical protein